MTCGLRGNHCNVHLLVYRKAGIEKLHSGDQVNVTEIENQVAD